MRPLTLGTAGRLVAALGCAILVAVAWSYYRNPAMGLMLGAFRFCG